MYLFAFELEHLIFTYAFILFLILCQHAPVSLIINTIIDIFIIIFIIIILVILIIIEIITTRQKEKLFLQGGECPGRKGGSSPGKVEIFKILIMIMTSMIIMIMIMTTLMIMIMIMTTMMIMIVMTMVRLPNYPLHAPTELKARQKKK